MQLTMVLNDIGADAVKIGMLHNTSVIKCVCKILKKYKLKNVVFDPVMIAKGGARLVNKNSVNYINNLSFSKKEGNSIISENTRRN